MELFIIDATGPFFRGYDRKRLNWSKIPFMHLADAGPDDWVAIEDELREFARQVSILGYNAVTLDDLAHLAPHPLHEPEVADRIAFLRKKFTRFFDMLHGEFGLRVYLTSDVLPMTPALSEIMGDDPDEQENYYQNLVRGILRDFPQLAGLILRIGESDGNDVRDPIRTRLHLRDAAGANRLLRQLLPEFEARGRDLIFRTWTVGAHPIGDLMWHRDRLAAVLDGLESPNLIVSMKHGESDFFRHLPLNRAFFRVKQRKLIELQARREYEGAGEYPSFIGSNCERLARELSGVANMAGISVWCQTGGWHRFGRRAFLENHDRDIWIRFNAAAATGVFKHGESAAKAVERVVGPQRAAPALELLQHSEEVILNLLYIPGFAERKLFFRRVRIPPLLHVYWDGVFINHAVRKLLRHFTQQPEVAIERGEKAASLFPRMIDLAREAKLSADDIEHMRDLFELLLLARRYYYLPFDSDIATRIREAKRAYKTRWPQERRYRIKVSFTPIAIGSRTIAIGAGLLLRRKRGYRWLDRLFVLHGLGPLFRAFLRCNPQALPKLLRKSAMGVDTLFK